MKTPKKFITKNGAFESGELVKLGPSLWNDVYLNVNDNVWKIYNHECELENKMVLYINFQSRYKFHEILYNNKVYGIVDTFYKCDDEICGNIFKVK